MPSLFHLTASDPQPPVEAAGTGQSSRRRGPGGLSSAPRRWSENRSSGSFVGRSLPLPGAPRGHLICGVIDKCGRGAAGPPSPLFPPPPSRLPPSFLPEALPGGEPLQWGSACPWGRCPRPPPSPRSRAAPGRGRAASRASPGRGCRGHLRGKLRAARSPVSSEYSGTPRRRGRLAGSARAPVFRGHSPRRRERAWADGAIRRGSRAGGRP